jgi:hypothetical protein
MLPARLRRNKASLLLSGKDHFTALHCGFASYFARCAWGIALARDLKQITLLQVIEAIDRPIQFNVCVGSEEGTAPLNKIAQCGQIWCDAQNAPLEKPKNANFAQLLARGTATERADQTANH